MLLVILLDEGQRNAVKRRECINVIDRNGRNLNSLRASLEPNVSKQLVVVRKASPAPALGIDSCKQAGSID